MKIGVDISQIVYAGTGVARFTTGLVDSICSYGSDHEWHLVLSTLNGLYPNILQQLPHNVVVHKIPIPPRILSVLWNNMHVIKIEHITGPLDIYISSDWTQAPSNAKRATIIHDMAYLRFPETVDPLIRKTQASRLQRVSMECDVIFTDSESTREDVSTYLKPATSDIVVNYPGVYPAPQTHADIEEVRTRHGLHNPYILTVGKLEPRKNLKRLIDAYLSLTDIACDLAIVGETGWGDTPTSSQDSRIKFLGYIPDDDLHVLYDQCSIFVYPSIFEGFGYPVIEAMQHGRAVATSDSSSLTEIARGHAELFDPLITDSIASSISLLLTDHALRARYEKTGPQYAATFNWQSYYKIMIDTLTKHI